ncbi:MAG: hypothetical protein R6V35_00770 [Candidatus Nanohaloarchaea archaeon]
MAFEDFFRDTKINMYLAWIITALIVSALFESILNFDILWIAFTGAMTALIALPIYSFRNPRVMPPWEVLGLAAIPVIVRTLQISFLSNQVATYFAMAAMALIIAVELQVFTSVEFNHTFSIMFTVTATLAVAGLWAILRYNLDIHTGTGFLTTNEDLMYEFINATAAGLLAGVVFDLYFTRRDKIFRKIIRMVIKR